VLVLPCTDFNFAVPQVASALRPLASRLSFVRALQTCVLLRGSGRDVTRTEAAARVFEFFDSRTGRQYIAEPPEGAVQTAVSSSAVTRRLYRPSSDLVLLSTSCRHASGLPHLLTLV
jgi:hypothetical protein